MTEFVALCMASVALTEVPPLWGCGFILLAAVISKIKAVRCFSALTLPLMLVLCFLNLPTEMFLLALTGSVITSAVKKNSRLALPMLIILAFVFCCLDMEHGNNTDSTVLFLIPLLFCAAATAPKSPSKAASIALLVSLPAMFGGGKITTACILLPALTPVLISRVKSIYCNKKGGSICK